MRHSLLETAHAYHACVSFYGDPGTVGGKRVIAGHSFYSYSQSGAGHDCVPGSTQAAEMAITIRVKSNFRVSGEFDSEIKNVINRCQLNAMRC